ncbi:MAG: T9SS type B sorting domain-containing protein [Bacteroidia bacterium]
MKIGVLGFLGGLVWASHNLAGQITYRRVGTNTYEITLTTYTDSAAAGVDRCFVDIEVWNVAPNGTKTLTTVLRDIPRVNGPTGGCPSPARVGIHLRGPRVKKNFYVTTYTLPGPGVYELRYTDFARVENVQNMANSGAVSFYVETQLNNNPFLGINNSPLLLNDPIDDACIGKLWTHNPGGFDPDGDSLVYSLIPCRQYDPSAMQNAVPVPNYQYPSAFGGSFTIDRRTGLVTWNVPQRVGVYNISILIEEYRAGRRIGYVVRDMAIFVLPCRNDPPIINVPRELCVPAQTLLEFWARATDPNRGDSVYFYLNNSGLGFNGPFQVPVSPATITPNRFPIRGIAPPGDSAFFRWQTRCEHIRRGFYQIDWYAHDNFTYRPTLSAHAITQIYVVGPAPFLYPLTVGTRQITLRWSPPPCPVTAYRIYRSLSPLAYNDTCCRSSPSALGYTLVATVRPSDTTYTDADLEYNPRYCYRITALYGNVEGCPSNEECIQLPRSFPLMTQDSVHTTDALNGAIWLSWAPPAVLDTAFFPPPYTYTLYRGQGMNPQIFQPIATGLTDTTYLDQGINTETFPYRYYVILRTGSDSLPSNRASSIFLTVNAFDSALELEWEENVPWRHQEYRIYRADPPNFTPYNLIATIPGSIQRYLDRGLVNGQTYCYYVLGVGTYDVPGIMDPLLNASQKVCKAPIDTTTPCPPSRGTFESQEDCKDFSFTVSWQKPDTTCGGDVGFYRIYLSSVPEGPYTLVATLGAQDTVYRYQGTTLLLCLRISSVDTSGNEGPLSEPICWDNCPTIMMPNTFTPNGDGYNDVLKPFAVRSIRSIRFYLYDRWGLLIHTSHTLEPLWDGTYQGAPAPEGVYFYVLEAETDTRSGFVYRKAGHITLLR